MDEDEEERFFAELNAGYAALTPEERAEDAAELALWDGTLMDGLEDEPYDGVNEDVGAVLKGLRDPDAVDELVEARVTLCDLLWGRWIRAHAEDELERALWLEEKGATGASVDDALASAAHREWMARIAEQGQVLWGNRNNRCGRVEDEHGVDRGDEGARHAVHGRASSA